MTNLAHYYRLHIRWRWVRWQNNQRIDRLAVEVKRHAPPSSARPVVFFNASTRLGGLSLNAAYQLLASWGLHLQEVPVVHFACRAGLAPCPLGTHLERPADRPPCRECIAQSVHVYRHSDVRWFSQGKVDLALEHALHGLDMEGLMGFVHQEIPLGRLVLPTLRWVLRRHQLVDDGNTRILYQGYIRSAWRVAQEFSVLLDQVNPQALVVFNGMFYPEAAARYLAQQRNLRVITHEVGFQPFSAFFTAGEATAYPVDIPDDFALSPAQEQRLSQYLAKRFQGDFSMAGIRFWPAMHPLSQDFLAKAARFLQVVPVFTNVIFDTSQPHSNVVFEHMFAWLDLILELAGQHPQTLFVIRAHPDESRPGKESRESVRQWVQAHHVQELPNVVFIDASEPFSSYELIQRSKFVMIYNSTIGLEASILGAAVLCGGRARFTPKIGVRSASRYPTVFFPPTIQAYQQQAEEFLAAERVVVPPEFQKNARRFLYFQLYRTSLPFGRYLENEGRPGYVLLRDFPWTDLQPENSPVLKIIADAILNGSAFLNEDE
jgi:hypothetical protein